MFKVKSRTLGEANMPYNTLKFPVIASIKYDGRNTEVHKRGKAITYVTSGGKEFTLLNNTPFDQLPDGHYFAEMMGHGVEGKLGDRVHSGIQTTFVVNTTKGIANNNKELRWVIFSYLNEDDYNKGKASTGYRNILSRINEWSNLLCLNFVPENCLIGDRAHLDAYYSAIRILGYEGLMLAQPNMVWANSTSRLKTLVKMKIRPTMKSICIGTQEGTGKYEGMIGSLVLQCGVSVGSGLTDNERRRKTEYYIGKPIEISYESLSDEGLPLQPTFEAIREAL
jgi:hypothetical protein